MIEFEQKTHTYTVDGEVYPSVTQILQKTGIINNIFYTPQTAGRGREIHELTMLIDQYMLDDYCGEYENYINAYRKFIKDAKIKIIEIEKKFAHPTYKYAGTVDRIIILNDTLSILDIKTGCKEKWHGVQLAGYMGMIPNARKMYGLYINKNGNYKLEEYEYVKYQAIFLSALSIYNWKK